MVSVDEKLAKEGFSGSDWVLNAGSELDSLSESEQAVAASQMSIVSRVEPSHKKRLVELLKSQVAFTSVFFEIKQHASLISYLKGILLDRVVGFFTVYLVSFLPQIYCPPPLPSHSPTPTPVQMMVTLE